MSFWFGVKEGMAGFKRARLASTITVISIGITLMLIGFFALTALNVNRWIAGKKAQIQLEVFLEPVLKEQQAQKVTRLIRQLDGVAKVEYISKEQAARRFEREFGQKVEQVLGTNPLPPSCTVYLKPAYRNSEKIHQLVQKISALEGVDEVLYEQKLLALIERYLPLIYLIAAAIGLLLALVSVVLVHNTIRLTIFARSDIIEIMKLVGATSTFIRRPFVIQGFLQGLFGALLAIAALMTVTPLLKETFFPALTLPYGLMIFLLIAGVLIGWISSKLSVSKYLWDVK